MKAKNIQILRLDEKNSLVDYSIANFDVKELDIKNNVDSEIAKKMEKLKTLQSSLLLGKNKKITAY